MTPPRVVVGAAIVRGRHLLAVRRTAPVEIAGRWELPGGKVEPGEPDDAALVREIEEELAVRVAVERWLPGEVALTGAAGPLVLRVALARLEEGEPTLREHDRLRWLGADELEDVDWLDGDRPFVAALALFLAD